MHLVKLILLFSLVHLCSLAQQTVGVFKNHQNSVNGYVLVNPIRSPFTYLIDNCGNKVYEWDSSNISLGASILNNGNLLRSTILVNDSIKFGGSTGGLEILDPSSNQIWSFEVNTDKTMMHHDFLVIPNGNILFFAVELISREDVVDSGSEVSAKRLSEMIFELNPENNEIVWAWRAWDHLVQDFDSTLSNFGAVEDYPEKINLNYYFDETDADWLHFNSIDYNEKLDQIIVSSPHFNEFWIIDHSTNTEQAAQSYGGNSNKGGDLLYRWGNPLAYGRGDSLSQSLYFQHNVHWIKEGSPNAGKIMVFNNGDYSRPYSSVDIIDVPVNPIDSSTYLSPSFNNPYLPLEPFYSYSDSTFFYSAKVSSAQLLENGNTFICSGWQGRIFEIENQSNSIVWDYVLPVNIGGFAVNQGDAPEQNLIFKSTKYLSTFAGFDFLDLQPTSPIELNPLPNSCQLYINGCTDSSAINYITEATVDDYSCVSIEQHTIDSLHFLIDQLNSQLVSCSAPISIDLAIGWNLIGYDRKQPQNLVACFQDVLDIILVVKNNSGETYFPEFNFNGIGDLIPGQGYQLKVSEGYQEFMFVD